MPTPDPRGGDDAVIVSVDDGIATVTLHRPDVRNAINGAMRRGWWEALTGLDADPAVAAIILTGTDPAFCAGLDLRELGRSGSDLEPSRGGSTGSRSPFPPLATPLIGAVNGPAITGGFELALNCDFLIASERARFADTHSRVGVMPGWGLTPLLAAAVGRRRARQISLTGNFVSADQALVWGLVNEVVPHEDLLPRCRALAADIAANDRPGVTRMLATYRQQDDTSLAAEWAAESAGAAEFGRQVGFDASEVENRRQGIIDRGRSQM